MAEELKENEETKEETSEETSDQTENIESASTVETEPTTESEKPVIDLAQLEQRVTSLEQRLLATESQPTEQPTEPPTEEPVPDDKGDEDSEDSSEIESTEEIAKLLNL